MDQAAPIVHIDNDDVRVTTWSFAADAATGWHRHEYPYVVIPLATGALAITGPDGAVATAALEHGAPYYRQAGVEHDVKNASGVPFAFVEVEIKR